MTGALSRAARLAAIWLAILSAAPVAAQEILAWIEGDWHDPRMHRCGQVWIRIAVEDGGAGYAVYQRTYGREVRAAGGPIRDVDPGGLTVLNEAIGRVQRMRYVSPDAHVLERPNGSGGVTFVRCPGDPAGLPLN